MKLTPDEISTLLKLMELSSDIHAALYKAGRLIVNGGRSKQQKESDLHMGVLKGKLSAEYKRQTRK